MKKLFAQLLLFAVLSFSIYGSYIAFIGYVFNKDSLYRLPADKTVLILGNSHTACDINDTLLEHSFNLSQPADAVSNSYEKLKKFLPLNPVIKTVIMGFSEGDITVKAEEDEELNKATEVHIDNYFYLMEPGELMYLLIQNPKKVLTGLVSLPRSRTLLCYRILKSQADLTDLGLGRYQRIGGVIDTVKELNKFAKENFDVSAVSERRIDYLRRIAAFCRAKNVKLILMRMPEHRIFVRRNEKTFLDILRNQFPDVPFKDYVNVTMPDTFFQDHDHLNFNGAALMTDSVSAYLKGMEGK